MDTRDLKSQGTRFPSNVSLRALIIALLFLSVGCLPPKEDQPCFQPYEKIIEPLRIVGGHHMYFDVDDFDFLDDTKIQVEELVWEGEIDGLLFGGFVGDAFEAGEGFGGRGGAAVAG